MLLSCKLFEALAVAFGARIGHLLMSLNQRKNGKDVRLRLRRAEKEQSVKTRFCPSHRIPPLKYFYTWIWFESLLIRKQIAFCMTVGG